MKFHKLSQSKQYIAGISISVLLALVLTTAFPQIVAADTTMLVKEVVEAITEDVVTPEFPVSKDTKASYEMWVLATAYTSEVAQTDSTPCIPAMGSYNLCENYEKYGLADTIAANFLGLGRQVRFEIEGVPFINKHKYVVRDRMNRKYNGTNRIDIWMASKDDAIEFGARWIKMKVYPNR